MRKRAARPAKARPRKPKGRASALERLAHIERIAQIGTWEADLANGGFTLSDQALRLHGLEPGAFPGTIAAALDLVHPEERGRVTAAFERALATKTPFAADFRIVRPDGAVRHMHAEDAVVRDAGGAAVRIFGITQDVTIHKEAVQALRLEQERLRLLTENVPAMIAYVDAGRCYRYANVQYRRFYAGSDAPIAGRPMEEVLTPEIWSAVRSTIDRALAGETLAYVGERRLRDGSVRHVSVSQVPHRDEAGAVVGIYILAMDITAQHRAEATLRESEAGLRHAQDMAYLAYVVVRPDGSYERWSENWPRLVGRPPGELPRSTRESLDMVHAEDRERFRAAVLAAAATRERSVVEYRFVRGDGSLVHVHQAMEPLGEADAGGRSRWFVTIQDVTGQKRAEERIRRLNRVYAVLSGINGAIVRIRDRQELFAEVCRIAVDLGGFRYAWLCTVDAAAGQLVPVAHAGEAGDFLESVRARLSLRDDAPAGHGVASTAVRESRAVFVNDAAADALISNKALHRGLGIRSVAVLPIALGGRPVAALGLHAAERDFFDAEEQRLLLELAGDIGFALDHIEKEEKVRYLAYYDELTGLANRTLFLERLAEHVRAAAPRGRRFALLVVNIERFKTINDTLGRQAGDALLRQVAARLIELAGDPAHVARVGADHFAVVIPSFSGEKKLTDALERANRRVDGAPYEVGGTELRIATQAGVALHPSDGSDAETLFRNAEAALRKSASGEHFLFYTPAMTARISERLELENQLRRALERDEFVLHYQPKVDLQHRRMAGMEALIRWQSPARGLVPPMEFIPLLEDTGLIQEVGAWALRRAVRDHRAWSEQGLRPPRVAVNVSAIQLRQAAFPDMVREALGGGTQPPGIDLEITESVIMQDVEAALGRLEALRALGLEVAIDDFGTGYSSLAYLARLPVQALKIDRSFIIKMQDDANTMTLVSTVVSLAHSLRLKVVAEGVDREEQARTLQLLRCDEMQGYLVSRPVPAVEIEAMLRRAG